MTARTPVGEAGKVWVRRVGGASPRWQASVWVRDLDGRRRVVQASGRDRSAAVRALEVRLDQRRPLGFCGVDPQMSVQELGEYWMRRRRAEMSPPVTGPVRGSERGVVSAQTLAGYQTALSRIINPQLVACGWPRHARGCWMRCWPASTGPDGRPGSPGAC